LKFGALVPIFGSLAEEEENAKRNITDNKIVIKIIMYNFIKFSIVI
tara:strand:- start:886 stop:1023 length:138 start_codon:yes stop_codon:yes gene_type:complete